MKDPAFDEDVVGYCGVVVPPLAYQGFFIHKGDEEAARDTLKRARSALLFMPDLTGSEVRHPAPGVAPDDQPLLGTLCSAVVELCTTGRIAEVAPMIGCIRLLTGQDYFWFSAFVTKAGTTSAWAPLKAGSAAEAREVFKAQPTVLATKALEELTKGTRR